MSPINTDHGRVHSSHRHTWTTVAMSLVRHLHIQIEMTDEKVDWWTSASLAGVSRSVTITAAYMMSVTSLNAKDALKCIKGARAMANPNDGFLKQLQQFENTRLKEVSIKFKLKV
ncbi:hypothetical protein RND71_043348 [Anisodus tanguticus]|uniref:Tyrosine-protein phosphatase domain-containing protein n=1 Tax=Anisodus tanguticus TaxID=243964 RepID=A0AAE1QPJ9_9SOLA|nr:hypothetical protein RND71_043348 [Anisodus tanguticus]